MQAIFRNLHKTNVFLTAVSGGTTPTRATETRREVLVPAPTSNRGASGQIKSGSFSLKVEFVSTLQCNGQVPEVRGALRDSRRRRVGVSQSDSNGCDPADQLDRPHGATAQMRGT